MVNSDHKIQSIIEDGNKGIIVDVECHLANSLPNIIIVGFANKSVDEAKERIRGAFAASKIKLPRKRITINLAPADIPKSGSSFDLPMILSIMQQAELTRHKIPSGTVALGEVGLDGTVKPIRGLIGKILAAKQKGINQFYIPSPNVAQASLIPDIKIYPVKSIHELYSRLNYTDPPQFEPTEDKIENNITSDISAVDFADVIGQEPAKRSLAIAAAGQHNILLSGPPGTGKSMLAKALISVLPPLSKKERLEATHIHSLASKNFEKIVNGRPVRNPHHSSSSIAIIGGGQTPRPGEISLSHHGVLFLDEFPEFKRDVVEALRQPMEDRVVTISRAKDSIEFPAHFLLVATANPCPCGNFGSKAECICSPNQIMKYHKKLSGPILDRIDLYVNMEPVKTSSLLGKREAKSHSASKLSDQINEARGIQIKRSGKLNSELDNRDIKRFVNISDQAKSLLDQASRKFDLSARGYMRTLKISRTIADLEGSDSVSQNHISEALQYRRKPVLL